MTKATDNFAKSVLSGIISVAGTVPNAIVKSRVGRAFFRTGPGEVALASMISFCESRINPLLLKQCINSDCLSLLVFTSF